MSHMLQMKEYNYDDDDDDDSSTTNVHGILQRTKHRAGPNSKELTI